ncbi:MAG: PEP-CTERM sorting domain-containing protein [Planctomycetota bacterium]
MSSLRHRFLQGLSPVTPVIGLTGPGTEAFYDNVYLSHSIPEPASLGLLALGGLALRRRRHQ